MVHDKEKALEKALGVDDGRLNRLRLINSLANFTGHLLDLLASLGIKSASVDTIPDEDLMSYVERMSNGK
jgi:hypothetical protein